MQIKYIYGKIINKKILTIKNIGKENTEKAKHQYKGKDMSKYIDIINKIISESNDKNTGVLIVDKNGYIEYFKPYIFYDDVEVDEKAKKEIGKHILDLYPELNEKDSTVIHCLKTGDTIIEKRQEFTWNEKKISFNSTTYPIIENGEIRGVVDLATAVNIRDINSSERYEKKYTLDDIVTQNETMIKLKENIRNIANNNSSVLIYGETGTGKELVAESIHMEGNRKNKPFISQNCAAIPSTLLESIFFGTEKGGFTGAETRKGLFEMANGGTLFLDEINSMEITMQAKLLRAIEEKKIRRIGGNKDIHFDIRLICATNEHPEKLIENQIMRQDLYYRIAVVFLEIPPLRKRKDDIKPLIQHFINKYNKQMKMSIKGIMPMVEEMLYSWVWPGNVRELGNVIESAFNMERGEYISLSSLEELRKRIEYTKGKNQILSENHETYKESILDKAISSIKNGQSIDISKILEDIEKEIIIQCAKEQKTLSKLAEMLSMSPQKLQYRINKLNIKKFL